MLEKLLAELGPRIGIDRLGLEDSGVCQLIIDDALDIVIETIPGEDAAYVYATVLQEPGDNADAIYGKLLRAHLFGAETGDAYFAVGPSDEIMLVKRVGLSGMDCDAFQNQLQEFLNWTLSWQARLSEGDAAATSDAADAFLRV